MSTGTLIAASALGLGLGGMAWYEVAQARVRDKARRVRKPTALPPPPGEVPDVDGDETESKQEPQPAPEPKPEPLAPYVGSGWADWPHLDEFPNEASFAERLARFGYLDDAATCLSQNDGFLEVSCAVIVGAFQQDFNLVRAYMLARNMEVSIGDLELTEKIDAETTMALVYARSIEEQAGQPWPGIVQTAEIYFS